MPRLALLALLVAGCAPDPASAQTVLDVAPFRSVALGDGGRVTIRYGATQRVALIAGEADVSVDGTQLRIGRCRACPRRDHPQIEIVTPALESLSVANGGRLVVAGDFPRRPGFAASVSNGGMIDLRALAVDGLAASVEQGGIIYARPSATLTASIRQGGNITYWGEPAVQSAVEHGGVVQRGRDEDESRPLDELGPVPAPAHPPRPPKR